MNSYLIFASLIHLQRRYLEGESPSAHRLFGWTAALAAMLTDNLKGLGKILVKKIAFVESLRSTRVSLLSL